MKTPANIANLLVVSRDLGVLRSISTMKGSNCWHFETASNGWAAMERIQAGASPHLLLLDLPEGDGDCLDMLRWMHRIRPALPVILIGHSSDAIKPEESTRLGAKAYLTRPLDERLLASVIESSLSAEAATTGDPEAEGSSAMNLGNDASSASPSQLDENDLGVKSLRSVLKSVRSEAERNAIARALEKTGGNRKAAARLLKVSYRTVLYKIEEYKMIPHLASEHLKSEGTWEPTNGVRENVGSSRPDERPLKDRRKELQ